MQVQPSKVGHRRCDVLLIASAGGHWEQLILLKEAFSGRNVHYVTTLDGLAYEADVYPAHIVPDCHRGSGFGIVRSAFALLLLIIRLRPRYVITTGALPGLLALAIARRLGARTAWIDSVANAEEMSLAGTKARKYADLWLSQWPDVARAQGAGYAGSIL